MRPSLFHSVLVLATFSCSALAMAADDQSEELKVSTASTRGQLAVEPGFTSLFDGQSLKGWQGDHSQFRVEDGAIVGGSLSEKIPHNFFLTHRRTYGDFELRLKFRLKGKSTNAGIQIRSKRIPNHHEMIGYQADLGQQYWGALYDESRRRKVLAGPDLKKLSAVLKKDGWNDYRIVCKGKRIQLWINKFQTVDYTESDDKIEQSGLIGLQIHGSKPGEAWYKHIRVRAI